MAAPFVLLTAFSNTPNGGNPAAVVFTDLTQPEDVFKNTAQNLNQPITAFVSSAPLSLSTCNPKSVAFSVRWYTPSRDETPLCGHGTLAAAKAIFERSDVAPDVEVVELHTHARGVVKAIKREGGSLEIQLPALKSQQVFGEEFIRLSKVLNETSGRELAIEHIATGGKGFEHYIMFVLDEKEDLKNLPVNPTLLRKAGFFTNIYTTLSSNTEERFISRMFAPGAVPGDEDHVCGSAHCLMVPYWYQRLGIAETTEIKARQVSARGGVLNITLDGDIVKLAGDVLVLGKGELQLA
ncbi:hypothetical protein H0H92_005651 [Tricholoma furcatifolium]|nr:hypothetical protein H0H92_005651 [Tricholoma furcatifolium]